MVVQMFLRTIFISLPEELFLTLLILLCSNLRKFLLSLEDSKNIFNLKNFYKFGSISIITALYSQILRQFDINEIIQFFSALLLIYLLIIWLYRCTSKESIIEVALATAFLGVLLVFFETPYYATIVKLINCELAVLSKSVWLALLCTIPERILMYSVIAFLIIHYKTQNECKKGFFELLFANKTFTFITIVLVFCDLMYTFFMGRLILFKQILSSLPLQEQLVYISIMLSISFIILIGYFLGLYSHLKRDYTERYKYIQSIEIMKDMLTKIIPSYEAQDDEQKKSKFDVVIEELNDFESIILSPLGEERREKHG